MFITGEVRKWKEAIVDCLFFFIIIFLQFGVHPVAVDLTLVKDKEIGLYTKGTIPEYYWRD
jgi:hypothetical protein